MIINVVYNAIPFSTHLVVQQVRWWMLNRTRAGANKKKGADKSVTAVLPLMDKKGRGLLPYQAYMRLYTEKVMPEIPVLYEAYRAAEKGEGRKPKGQWAFTIEEMQRQLNRETDEVKQEVDAYILKHEAEKLPEVLTSITELAATDLEKAREQVRALQR